MRKLFAAVVAAVGLGVVSVSGASAAGGNAANAKLCQQGGWLALQRPDLTQFADQDSCVSYGATGGTISSIPPRQITVTVGGQFPYCSFAASVTHFRANTRYTGTADWNQDGFTAHTYNFTLTTDATGSGSANYGTWVSGGPYSYMVVTIDGTTGTTSPLSC